MEPKLDQLLLTKADLIQFRDISANVGNERIDTYVRETQTIEIRDFIGAELYTLLQLDFVEVDKEFTQARFNDLWYGVDYPNAQGKTIRFNGLICAGIYWSYARFLVQQNTNVSRFGVESVQNEISEDLSNPQVRIKARDAQQVALRFQNDAERFLKARATVYPEYKSNEANPKKTAFTFFRV